MMGEFDLITRFFASDAVTPGVAVGIGDDAAVLRVPDGCDLVAAVDTIVEARHFPTGSDPRSIGHRALAVNLSDMAAMGAQPAWGPLAVSIQILGFVPRGQALLRGGARAGDLLAVTGALGDAGAGLALVQAGAAAGTAA